MSELVTIQQVLEQLRVDPDTDNALIHGMLAAATRAVEIHTGRTVAEGADAFGEQDGKVAAQAILLLVSTWYDNRDSVASNTSAAEMPLAVSWLLWPLKRLTV